jgi:hypothetical protein
MISNLNFNFFNLSIFKKAIFLIISFLIASTLGMNKLQFIFSIFLLVISYKKNTALVVNKYTITLSLLFIWGVFMILLYILLNPIDEVYYSFIYGRIKLYFLHFLFAISLYSYLLSQTYSYVKNIVFFGASMNVLVGLTYFTYAYFQEEEIGRLSFLSFEPSMAAVFYSTFFFFILANSVENKGINLLSKFYLFFGLLARSKIQFFTVIFAWLASTLKSRIGYFLLIITIVAFILFDLMQVMNALLHYFNGEGSIFNQIYYTVLDIKFILEEGLFNLIYDNSVGKPSYVVRLSAMHMAFYDLIDNILGSGWGGFNHYYLQKITELNYNLIVQDSFTGGIEGANEIDDIYSREQEATPKSFLLEILTSTGIFGFTALTVLIRRFSKHYKDQKPIVLSFFSLLLVSFFSESAPSLALLSILVVLLKKSNSQRKYNTPKKNTKINYSFFL